VLPTGYRVLDLGCGTGGATIAVARRFGAEVVGVDIDPEQIAEASRVARDVPNVRFEVGDAQHLPFRDEAFDVVYSSRALHHVPQWTTALEEAIRVLRTPDADGRGGYLVYVDLFAPTWVSTLAGRLPSHRGGVTDRRRTSGESDRPA
jgi:ubiquinone/menaquinone biosynthesis C-methylase UbiE